MTTLMTDMPRRDGDGHEPDLNALSALVDGRVDGAERDRIIEHLAECARCRDIVATLQQFATTAAPPRRWSLASLSLAATIAVVAAGAGLYVAVGRAPERIIEAPAEPAKPPQEAPVSAPQRQEQPPTSAPRVDSPRPSPDRTRAAGTRAVGGKTFRLVAGEWIDTAYTPTDLLPIVEVSTRADFDAHPALRAFSALGSRFTVVIDGTAYRVALSATQH